MNLKNTTTEDEARITQLHTRNRPCSIALRRDSGRVITAFLAVFSVVEKIAGHSEAVLPLGDDLLGERSGDLREHLSHFLIPERSSRDSVTGL